MRAGAAGDWVWGCLHLSSLWEGVGGHPAAAGADLQHRDLLADDDEPVFECFDTHPSNKSTWKPAEVPLDEGRILVLEAD